ncbi:hypothetical protein [Mycolicibacterium fortuitum]
MGVWIVDPDWYFHTAEVLGSAASTLGSAVGTVAANAAGDTNNMAGNDEVGTAWGSRYDTASRDTVEGVTMLAQAWSSLAARIYQAGINHAWAQFRAGRGRIPTPANLPPRPAITEPTTPSFPSSIGDNGPGLAVSLNGLESAVGKPVPNANSFTLANTAESWATFAKAIDEAVNDVSHGVQRPDPALPDATKFYDSITNLGAPGDALGADALSLSTLTANFSTGVVAMRGQIQQQLAWTAFLLQGSAAVTGVATAVTGTVAIGAEAKFVAQRVRAAGENIRGYINTLQTLTSVINTFAPAFLPTMKALLNKERLIDIEIFDPDGTRTHHYRIPLTKWLAWINYLERGGQEWQWDRWSDNYDQLKENSTNGYWFDQWVAKVNGYDAEHGWESQWGNKREHLELSPVPNRVWDWVNLEQRHLVENKHGALDLFQLTQDEIALREGWNVTWNINDKYPHTASEIAALERLERLYPGQFKFNRM